MDATGIRLQRALVHRHTAAGRRFWQEAADTLEDLPGDRAVMLVALAREAGCGHDTVQDWVIAACPDALPAVGGLTAALDRFTPPAQTRPRSRRLERVGQLVRRSVAEVRSGALATCS